MLPSKRQQSCQALPLSENRCKLLEDLPRWPLLTAARCAGSSFVAHHHCLVYGRVARPFMGGCKVRASKAFQRQAGTKVIYLDPDGLRRLLPVVEEWSATLTEIQRRRLNHRSTALRNYRATAVGPAPDSIISGYNQHHGSSCGLTAQRPGWLDKARAFDSAHRSSARESGRRVISRHLTRRRFHAYRLGLSRMVELRRARNDLDRLA